jgi:hypothetical protein
MGRGLLDIAGGLGRIATALERIADAAEGKALPEVALPDPPAGDPYERVYRDDQEMARMSFVEAQLAAQLGREPTAEEIVRVVDGIEWTEGDARAHAAAVRKAGGHLG